jgi:enoyl-CoA hydratase
MEDSKNYINYKDFIQSFSTLKIDILKDKKILHVQLNRPNKLNALNDTLFIEIQKLFTNIDLITTTEDIRVIIISGNGKSFTSGLDLNSNIAQNILTIKSNTEIDSGRKAFFLYKEIKNN